MSGTYVNLSQTGETDQQLAPRMAQETNKDDQQPQSSEPPMGYVQQPEVPVAMPIHPIQPLLGTVSSTPNVGYGSAPNDLPLAQSVAPPAYFAPTAIPIHMGLPGDDLPMLEPQYMEILRLSKATRWFAMIDIVLCGLYVTMALGWVALIALVGPVLGYHGARVFNKNHVAIYIAFIFIVITFRFLSLVIWPTDSTSLVFAILIIFIEIFIVRIVIRLYILLKRLSPGEVIGLRRWYNYQVNMSYW